MKETSELTANAIMGNVSCDRKEHFHIWTWLSCACIDSELYPSLWAHLSRKL